MKRFKVINSEFDGRASVLKMDITDDWDDTIKSMWENNKKIIIDGLLRQFGSNNFDVKLENFKSLDSYQPSLIAFHNVFFREIVNAYTFCSYYPALLGACALGERILNHLILKLRFYFKNTTQYQRVYKKKSFDNWDLAIETLEAWEVLLPEIASKFRDLKEIRNHSIHFNIETEADHKNISLDAILCLKEILRGQFSAFGDQPWYIKGTLGACFVSNKFENVPFVKEIILPNCVKVGHLHQIKNENGKLIIVDLDDYADIEISDKRFVELLANPEKFNQKNQIRD